jgi:hypothetical protein
LSGRRLRHLNDEVLLKKWADSKEKGEAFDVEQETASGLDLWFLSVPSWGEGVKIDQRKKFLKPRLKTTLCLDWLRARKTHGPPKNASKDWGCPRGMYCEFAHGEEELRGAEKTKIFDQEKTEKDAIKRKHKEDYLRPLSELTTDNAIESMVQEGLKVAKKSRALESKSVPTSVDHSSNGRSYKLLEGVTDVQLFSGSAAIENVDHGVCLSGNSKFSSAGIPAMSLTQGSSYYEIELMSDGLMQLGWADMEFLGGNSSEGDGVGDDPHSWAIDLFRKNLIHSGTETPISISSEGWSVGDVIGFFLKIHRELEDTIVEMRFSLNGVLLEQGFNFTTTSLSEYFPAFSLEDKETILVTSSKRK